MESTATLTVAHGIYLASVAVIILTMILRANVVVPSIIGTFLVVTALTSNPISGLIGIFRPVSWRPRSCSTSSW